DEHPLMIGGVDQDRVQAHATRAWLPARPGAVFAQTREFLPIEPAISRPKDRRILHAGIDGIRICQRRFQVPNTFEFPRMRCAVVPLMSARNAVVRELVPDRAPCLAAIIRPLNDLAEPTTRLRRIEAI